MNIALTDTRQVGERKREEWLVDFAMRSATAGWTKTFARKMAHSEVVEAVAVGHLESEKAIKNAVGEGALAAHPDVRDHVSRLIAIRDELWKDEPDYLRHALLGPSQILIELMRRQKSPSQRRYSASASAFLEYLRNLRFAKVK